MISELNIRLIGATHKTLIISFPFIPTSIV